MSNKNDFVGAFDHMPKNSRLLYLHAYQSLVWNKAVSARLKLHGNKVLVGDLVLLPDKSGKFSANLLDRIVPTDDDEAEVAEEKTEEKPEENGPKKSKKHEVFDDRIVTVTEENISDYSIFDVIMPVPGWRVKCPTNESLKIIYEEILAGDGLDQGFRSLKHKTDFYSLPGAYRKIVVKPWDFSWKFVSYSDPNEDLILSDLDLLRKKELPSSENPVI
jgi:tRNA pseudouridine13 synthase